MTEYKLEIITEYFGHAVILANNEDDIYYSFGHLNIDELEQLEIDLTKMIIQLYNYRKSL